MTISLSRGVCEALAGKRTATVTSATITLDAGDDYIEMASRSFVTLGFATQDVIYIPNATNTSNQGPFALSGVLPDTLSLPSGSLAATQSSGTITVVAIRKASFNDMFFNSKLAFRSGTKPSSADLVETGTELVLFEDIKWSDVTWDSDDDEAYIDLWNSAAVTATASNTGTCGWFRMYGGGTKATGASATSIRMDGTIGVGTGDVQVANASITTDAVETLTNFKIRIPQS